MAGQVLVATVTAVFAAGAREGETAGSPEDLAAALLDHEDVTTVRVNAHGHASGYRVDVPDDAPADAANSAAAIADDVASRLGLSADVVSVGLVRDADRVEVYRVGEAGDDLVWGAR